MELLAHIVAVRRTALAKDRPYGHRNMGSQRRTKHQRQVNESAELLNALCDH